MIVSSQLALKTHTNLGCAASFAMLDKLVDQFTLPPAALPIDDASLTHVIKLAAHSTTSPTNTAMRQSFIMNPYNFPVDTIIVWIGVSQDLCAAIFLRSGMVPRGHFRSSVLVPPNPISRNQ
jgi:hypothetical protein